jgi:hypothetical protein
MLDPAETLGFSGKILAAGAETLAFTGKILAMGVGVGLGIAPRPMFSR